MKGKLVILSGPSGVGKDTLINRWQQINPRIERVIAYTTRAMRPGEREGFDYHFVDRETFMAKAHAGEFLEYKEVHGNMYATPLHDMEALLANGQIAILKIDVQGALLVMELRPDAISIFIEPPSWYELEERIRGRQTDAEDMIAKRLRNAADELALAERYQYQVINDDLDEAVDELEEIVS